MTFARLLRIWTASGSRARCRECHQTILWVIDDLGKFRPFDPAATPVRIEEPDERGRRFAIYEPTAFHKCVAKRRRPAAEAR